MDQATAKKRVLAAMATTLDSDIGIAEYLMADTDEDTDRLLKAAKELRDEFERRAGDQAGWA